MTATSILVHTSSRAQDNALRIAHVAAAGRRAAERMAAERAAERRNQAILAERVAVYPEAAAWVQTVREAGAIAIGYKVCTDLGKYRFSADIDNALDTLLAHVGDDIEVWAIGPHGSLDVESYGWWYL